MGEGFFGLQDEITHRIVVAMRVNLTEGEEARLQRKQTHSIEAWNLLSQGVALIHRSNKADNATARKLFQRAIAADPGYALAHAMLASTHWNEAFQHWSEEPKKAIQQAAVLTAQAQALDPALPEVYALQGTIHLVLRHHDEAVAAAEKAVALSPNHATSTALLGMILQSVGRPQEAIAKLKRAMRLSPYYAAWFLEVLGLAYLEVGQPEQALGVLEKFLDRQPAPNHAAHAYVGRALAFDALGRGKAARAEIAKAVETDAEITLARYGRQSLGSDQAARQKRLAILRRLGLPE